MLSISRGASISSPGLATRSGADSVPTTASSRSPSTSSDGGPMRRRGSFTWILALSTLVALPGVGHAQSGLEVMQKSRQLHRVRDEQERQLVKLVSKSGAVKDRVVMR